MIVVHAAMCEGRMFVWGERSQDDHPPKGRRNPKDKRDSGKVKRRPFDAGREGILSAFDSVALHFKPDAKRFQDLTVWLPTKGEAPFPSSPMINVQVHKFVCAGTLEEKIDEMIEQKKTIAEQVVGAGEGWITELSNKDLKELWKLGKGGVEEKEVSIPKLPAALVRRLGSFPLWRGEEPFLESLESIYAGASPVGLSVYLGEREDSSRS
jgi:hypothetical protein